MAVLPAYKPTAPGYAAKTGQYTPTTAGFGANPRQYASSTSALTARPSTSPTSPRQYANVAPGGPGPRPAPQPTPAPSGVNFGPTQTGAASGPGSYGGLAGRPVPVMPNDPGAGESHSYETTPAGLVYDTQRRWDPGLGKYVTSRVPAGVDRGYGRGGGGDGGGPDFDFNGALRGLMGDIGNPPPAYREPSIAMPEAPDSSAATAAEFGRLKDRVGQVGRASMDSLSNEMSARGLSGSGMEAGAMTDITKSTAGALGEGAREQAISNLARRDAYDQWTTGAQIGQRGQDVGWNTTTRGQDIGLLETRLGMIPSLLALALQSSRRRY